MRLPPVEYRGHHAAGRHLDIADRDGEADILQLDENLDFPRGKLLDIGMGRAGGAKARIGNARQEAFLASHQMAERFGCTVGRTQRHPRDVDRRLLPLLTLPGKAIAAAG
ncbi:hypothetical protein FIV03_31810 (plasmid) [Labrenzia sp. THAF187b]|nr:hypothetical protein FIV03_31810 [Labrenzia sp. THAF187b]